MSFFGDYSMTKRGVQGTTAGGDEQNFILIKIPTHDKIQFLYDELP